MYSGDQFANVGRHELSATGNDSSIGNLKIDVDALNGVHEIVMGAGVRALPDRRRRAGRVG